jgi:hypothetical protein
MIPDAATIARRRHTVTMILRTVVVLFAGWVAWTVAISTGQTFQQMYTTGPGNAPGIFINLLLLAGPEIALVVVLVMLEGRLIRWIVPMPSRHPGCPKCGYSLKDLNSPICPECGTNLRA